MPCYLSQQYYGGCLPSNSSSARIDLIISRFKFNAAIVALPIGVNPTILTPSQLKCSLHICWRGWKNGTSIPVSVSSICCLAPFRSEQDTQASARFAAVVSPFATTGMIWSIWKVATWPAWEMQQYSQRLLARWTIDWRRDDGIDI